MSEVEVEDAVSDEWADQSIDDADVLECWEREVGREQTGRVRLTLTIDRHGEVRSSDADGQGAKLEQCLEAASLSWRFQTQSAGTLAATIEVVKAE